MSSGRQSIWTFHDRRSVCRNCSIRKKKACIKKGIANDLDSLLGRDCSAFLSVMICRYPGGMTRILSSVAGEVPAEDILNYGANGIAALLAQAVKTQKEDTAPATATTH